MPDKHFTVTSEARPIDQYTWGEGCQAWTLLSNDGLSIKQEAIPNGSGEQLHYHLKAQQYFYILKGEAVFEVDGVIYIVHQGEGIYIKPGQVHRVANYQPQKLMLLVTSQPATDNDRFNVT